MCWRNVIYILWTSSPYYKDSGERPMAYLPILSTLLKYSNCNCKYHILHWLQCINLLQYYAAMYYVHSFMHRVHLFRGHVGYV